MLLASLRVSTHQHLGP